MFHIKSGWLDVQNNAKTVESWSFPSPSTPNTKRILPPIPLMTAVKFRAFGIATNGKLVRSQHFYWLLWHQHCKESLADLKLVSPPQLKPLCVQNNSSPPLPHPPPAIFCSTTATSTSTDSIAASIFRESGKDKCSSRIISLDFICKKKDQYDKSVLGFNSIINPCCKNLIGAVQHDKFTKR